MQRFGWGCLALMAGVAMFAGCTSKQRQVGDTYGHLKSGSAADGAQLVKREAAVDAVVAPIVQPAGAIRLAGKKSRVAAGGSIQQVGFEASQVSAQHIDRCPPEPRLPAAGPSFFSVGPTCCAVDQLVLPQHFPDEYLCDGGDRGLPFHYESYERAGLETEDTIAEYVDHKGLDHAKPSTRTCIYAPRFAAVRVISQPSEGAAVSELADVQHSSSGGSVRTNLATGFAEQRDTLADVRMRSRAGGLESEAGQRDFAQVSRPAMHDKLLNTFEDLTFVTDGTFDSVETARLNAGLEAAIAWSREQNPVVSTKLDMALEAIVESYAATITGIDDKKTDEPGKLRVVKLADKRSAQPGEIVTFTIRYDNLGPNPVYEVKLVDNLTPRLAYVDDSTTSDRAGELTTADNGEGSQILTWSFSEPLAPGTGGVVTFQARVR